MELNRNFISPNLKHAQYEIKNPKENTRKGSHFVKWNIILAKGKEYKNDFESSGEAKLK